MTPNCKIQNSSRCQLWYVTWFLLTPADWYHILTDTEVAYIYDQVQKNTVMEPESNKIKNYNFQRIIDMIIRLIVLYLLFSWCFDVLQPFIYILIWGSIIAISVYPVYTFFLKIFAGAGFCQRPLLPWPCWVYWLCPAFYLQTRSSTG